LFAAKNEFVDSLLKDLDKEDGANDILHANTSTILVEKLKRDIEDKAENITCIILVSRVVSFVSLPVLGFLF